MVRSDIVNGSIVIIGDSTTSGTKYGGQGTQNWARIVEDRATAERLNLSFTVSGKGGSGYIRQGTGGTTFVTETKRLVSRATTLVVYFGSSNDLGVQGNYPQAVDAALDEVKSAAPSAKVLVVAPLWSRREAPPAQLAECRGVLAAEARSHTVNYLDPVGDNWLGDRVGMVGGDGVHPTDQAHRVVADRLFPEIKRLAVQNEQQ